MTPGTPTKRYLCQAPRPDAWDDHAEKVLKNLGGTREKRVANIRETLVLAKRRNHFTPKTGPGRKTNAEHAIAFYEFLLEKLGAKLPQECEDIDPSGKRDESEDDEDDEEEDMEEDSLQSCESTTGTEKGTTEHNYLCEVCDEPGELMICSECNLRFHHTCIRPVMTTFPGNINWRCSYCVLSTEPKNSTTRRQAAAAVRMMARLRNRCRRVKEAEKRGMVEGQSAEEEVSQEKECLKEPTIDKSNELTTIPIPTESPSSSRRMRNKVQLEEAEKPCSKKRELEEKIPSSLSVETDESRGRVKRARKQPTLYDPQLCPASKWESDDVHGMRARAKKTLDSQSETSDDDTASTKTKADNTPSARREQDQDVWCTFCGDDPSIKVCCFCACRVCFGKHHQTKLLLCDRCDDEYHTFCLDPPLKSVPKKRWFCPSCQQSEEKRLGRTSSRVETRAKWKSQSHKGMDHYNTSSVNYQQKEIDQQANQNQPRDSSGRFLSPETGGSRSKSLKTPTSESSRKRGRSPSLNKSLSSQRTAKNRTDSSSKGRRSGSRHGADTSSKTLSSSNESTPRRRQATYEESSSTLSESVLITVSRSGRTVKRNSFHDEIGQGEQHARTPRHAEESNGSHLNASTQKNVTEKLSTEDSAPMQVVASSSALMEVKADAQSTSSAPGSVVTSHVQGTALRAVESNIDNTLLSSPKESSTTEPIKAVTQSSIPIPHLASGISMDASNPTEQTKAAVATEGKVPRRKPGARECMQISRRFGADVIPQKYVDILLDYCKRGKVEHLIRMRERLDDHARFLESQLAGLEARLEQKGADSVAASTSQEQTLLPEVEAKSKDIDES